MYSERKKAKPYLVGFVTGNRVKNSKEKLENENTEIRNKIEL